MVEKVFVNRSELYHLGVVTLPNGVWPRGQHVDHPQYGELTYVGRADGWCEFIKGRKTEVQLDMIYAHEKVEQQVTDYVNSLRRAPRDVIDARLVAIAATQFELGFMALTKAMA